MFDSINHQNNENSIKLEAENCQKTEDLSDSSESWQSKDLEDTYQVENRSRPHWGRQHIKTPFYSNEDCNSPSSHNSSENFTISSENKPLQKLSSPTALQNTTSVKNSMNKRKRSKIIDTLGQVLIEIGLYDELYDFLKSRGVTAEALKYMQTRHVDELFRGTRLSTKIIFEHNLKEWQNKNGTSEVTTSQINTGHVNNTHQGVQLSPQLNITPLNQRLNETEITYLSNQITNAVQEAINKVLQEFIATPQQCQQFNSSNMQFHDEIPIDEDTLKNIKTEPSLYSEESYTPAKFYNKIDKKLYKLHNASNCGSNSKQSFDSITLPSKRRKMNKEMRIQDILSTFQSGQCLIEEYQKNGVFTSSQRTELVRTIVEFYMRNNQLMSISLCKRIADEIVELFPTETTDVYFYQESRSKPPRGKIWDRYNGQKRLIRRINGLNSTGKGMIKSDKNNDTRDTAIKTDWSDMEAICAEMKYIKDEKLLIEKWKDSFAFRRHQLQTGWFSNWKLYFDEYPFCKQQNYAKFIESDLDTLYPNLKFNDYLWDEFIKHFPTFFSNRIKHPRSKEIFEQLINDNNLESYRDYVAIKIVELLHAVLKTYGKQLKTIEEAQRQFTVEVTDLSDLKKIVIERKKLCADNNIQAKPYIAVVGHDKIYTHFSVILDSTGFSCDNYKDSLILCFNLYLFFELSFPYESLNVWTFIQQYFFNKPTLVINPRIESFISDINAQKLMINESSINGTQ